jgi:hypothetical protein
MKVRIGPVEGDLQHLVDDVERQVRADVEAAPDRWLRSVEVDADPVDRYVVALRMSKVAALWWWGDWSASSIPEIAALNLRRMSASSSPGMGTRYSLVRQIFAPTSVSDPEGRLGRPSEMSSTSRRVS